MNRYTVTLSESQDCYACDEQETVLAGMERLGRKGIPVGCRGGGCGVCKVRVTAGRYTARKMSRDCVSAEEEGQGFALACRIHPTSNLQVSVVGKMIRAIIRPSTPPAGGGACTTAAGNSNKQEI